MNRHKFSLNEYGDTIKEILNNEGEFRIYPSGTSMLPLIRENKDSVSIVKPSCYLKVGDIAFYQRKDGSYILHRVIKADNNKYTMCGDNQIKLENGITHRCVIGVVTKIYRNDNLINTISIRYKLYLLLWKSFFLRRLYFKLRHIVKGAKNEKK